MVCILNYMYVIAYKNATLEKLLQIDKRTDYSNIKVCYSSKKRKRVNKISYSIFLRQKNAI